MASHQQEAEHLISLSTNKITKALSVLYISVPQTEKTIEVARFLVAAIEDNRDAVCHVKALPKAQKPK